MKADLTDLCKDYSPDKIFVLLDENTAALCWPLVKGFANLPESHTCVISTGEENKNLKEVEKVWNFLGEMKADRKSLLINIGGGMLTDLGGFAAGTFKRGIDFINIPTTLLAMVDASVGGKTGVNFRGLKNEIGLIRLPLHVFLFIPFLRTLDDENFKSGFAEMLKAGLIADPDLWESLKVYDLEEKNEDLLAELLWQSVGIKKDIVDHDPRETGDRKALNFGHTIGHALESYCLKKGKSLLHGYAIAYGMIKESRISHEDNGLSDRALGDISQTLKAIYGPYPEEMLETESLIQFMRFDKKNERNRINFTLLKHIGAFSTDHYVEEEKIKKIISSPE